MALLEVNGIGKSFGTTKVLRDISFELAEGEALAIIGSSGSGKTTLLRCLNFLETADAGSITVAGCISGWCSRISTCSRSTRRCKT